LGERVRVRDIFESVTHKFGSWTDTHYSFSTDNLRTILTKDVMNVTFLKPKKKNLLKYAEIQGPYRIEIAGIEAASTPC